MGFDVKCPLDIFDFDNDDMFERYNTYSYSCLSRFPSVLDNSFKCSFGIFIKTSVEMNEDFILMSRTVLRISPGKSRPS